MHSISSSFFLRPWFTSAAFFPRRARYSNHSSDSSMRDILKEGNFFTDETKKVVLTCLRLETGSNIYYFWSFTMHSKAPSNFFSRPWCNSTPFYSKRTSYSVHLSVPSMGNILKRSNFFHGWDQETVLTCLRLETGSNIYYFWSFTMHSISSSIFFAAPVHFYSVLVEKNKIICSSQQFILRGDFRNKHFFHRWDQKIGFNLSTPGNRFQHLLLLKFHHALNIFIELLFAALLQFYSVLFEESKTICSSQLFIHGEDFRKKLFFTDETKKLVQTCLRLETGSNIYYFWSFTMHSKSSTKFFLRPWCISAPFYQKRTRYTVHLSDSSLSIFQKEAFFSQVRPKNWF